MQHATKAITSAIKLATLQQNGRAPPARCLSISCCHRWLISSQILCKETGNCLLAAPLLLTSWCYTNSIIIILLLPHLQHSCSNFKRRADLGTRNILHRDLRQATVCWMPMLRLWNANPYTVQLYQNESGDIFQFVCDAVLPSAHSGDLIHHLKCCHVIGCNAATKCIILYMDIIMHNSSKTVAAVLCFTADVIAFCCMLQRKTLLHVACFMFYCSCNRGLMTDN